MSLLVDTLLGAATLFAEPDPIELPIAAKPEEQLFEASATKQVGRIDLELVVNANLTTEDKPDVEWRESELFEPAHPLPQITGAITATLRW